MPVDGCRGLCLFLGTARQHASVGTKRKREYKSRLHVVNPATKQIEELPSLGNGCYTCCHLGYIRQSGEYKVWRKLHAVPVPTQNMLEEVVCPTSVTVGQFLYFSQCRRAIVAVNLHDETISSIRIPNDSIHCSFWLLKMRDRLCCVACPGKVVHTWVLKDLEECEWIKDCDSKLTARKNGHLLFSPVGWLENGQIFVSEFRSSTCVHKSSLIAHFAKKGKSKAVGISRDIPFYPFLIHTNSLVRW